MALPENIILSANLKLLEPRLQGREAYAILDSNVQEPRLKALFRPDRIFKIEAGEAAKRMATVETLAARLLDAGADRDALLVGLLLGIGSFLELGIPVSGGIGKRVFKIRLRCGSGLGSSLKALFAAVKEVVFLVVRLCKFSQFIK